MELVLPPGFEMGVATASWQIEGDVAGRGRCIWDDFADRPGAIVDGATGEPACDHVNRLEEDLNLLGWLGVDAYRFSISWPRVMPDGVGALSAQGLDFYDRLIDGLLERAIAPVATLFHWDLPSTLEAAGGWPVRDTALRFADYAQAMADRYADRVDRWATLNEPWCSAFLGYSSGYFAPGRTEPGASLAAAHHLLLGHGLAVERLRSANASNVGIVLNIIPVVAETPEIAPVARYIDGLQNRLFLDPLGGRGLPANVVEGTTSLTDWSFVHNGDLDAIASPIDWVGENYYTIIRVADAIDVDETAIGQANAAFPGCPPVSFVPRPPLTHMGWEVIPGGIVAALKQIADALPGVPLWVAENGAAVDEVVDATGVHDSQRQEYVRAHLGAVLDAARDGLDVRGYYWWSLLDNLEWASGWTMRFGLIHVEPETGERTPKDSAHWYRDLLAARA